MRPAAATTRSVPATAPRTTSPSAVRRVGTPLLRPLPALTAVFIALAVLVTPSLQPWLAQRHKIAAQQAQLRRLETQTRQLEAEKKRWNDPEYVRAEARRRLHYVLPGEVGLVLVPQETTKTSTDPRDVAATVADEATGDEDPGTAGTWYGTLWESVQVAGEDQK